MQKFPHREKHILPALLGKLVKSWMLPPSPSYQSTVSAEIVIRFLENLLDKDKGCDLIQGKRRKIMMACKSLPVDHVVLATYFWFLPRIP